MKGQYFICPVCNKSYTDKKTEERKKLIRFCPECGREMKTVEFRMMNKG